MVLLIQNWQRAETLFLRGGLARAGCGVVAVSEAHREATERRLNGRVARLIGALHGAGGRIDVRRIYNPVDDALAADDTPVDRDKLVYFSNKGLRQVLATFSRVRRAIPALELHVAGVSLDQAARRVRAVVELMRQPGVRVLGRLTQRELFAKVRESLCVFYPQTALSETFGLVFAESNALGTPVLAHDFGAAREVLGTAEQLVDAGDTDAVIARLRAWRAGGRPRVTLRPEFRLSRVLAHWQALFEGKATVLD